MENLQGMAGPDSSMRERRLLQGMIHSWQQELDRERQAMRDKDLQREEIPKENRYLLEERDAPMLEMLILNGTFSGTIFFWAFIFPAPLLPKPFALCGPVLAKRFLTPSSFC